MLIFKIICIVILIALIIVFALGTCSISKALKSNQYDEGKETTYARFLCKVGWGLLIANGIILIYVIMN